MRLQVSTGQGHQKPVAKQARRKRTFCESAPKASSCLRPFTHRASFFSSAEFLYQVRLLDDHARQTAVWQGCKAVMQAPRAIAPAV